MKKIYWIFALVVALGLTCCSEDANINVYDGHNFVQFADSEVIMPVTEDNRVFEVAVGMNTVADYDRSVALVVDAKNSNALEGYHFTLESHNVVIPAGELATKVRIHGIYEKIGSVNDSLVVTLRILTDKDNVSQIYGNKIRVRLQKVRPFRIEDYVGDMQITCTFPYSTSAVTRYMVKTEKIDDHTLLIKKPFEDRRDMVITFTDNKEDPMKQDIHVKEQVAFTDNTFGPVSMASVDGVPSYYLPEDRAFVLYMDAFLSQMGSFGSYYYIFEWVAEE